MRAVHARELTPDDMELRGKGASTDRVRLAVFAP